MTATEAHEEAAVNLPMGETLSVLERVIVAPTWGIFHRLDGGSRMNDGDLVVRGDVIGTVQSLGASNPIQSPFEGLLMAILAIEGERVRPGQPVAWLRVAWRGRPPG
jgi:biotin carboxyl carrier protein